MKRNDINFIKKFRTTEYNIHPLILTRWSPRAMSGETINKNKLMSLFEAAKWAPSANNGQPWRFLYATKNSKNWSIFFNLLAEFNQLWVEKAGALILVLSRNNFEYKEKPNPTHSFDTGSAWLSIALEANNQNLIAHAMAGFDYDKARQDLKIPKTYTIEAMIAVGLPGKKIDLPENFREKEQPSDRKKIIEIVQEGIFSFPN